MARYGQSFKDKAVARLLPPESAAMELVAKEMGIAEGTLQRWKDSAQSMPARGRAWTASARLQAVITTAALSEADKSAWCREQGIYPSELELWCASATTALAEPQDARASPQATRQDRKRIKISNVNCCAKTAHGPKPQRCWCCQKKSRRSTTRARTHDRP